MRSTSTPHPLSCLTLAGLGLILLGLAACADDTKSEPLEATLALEASATTGTAPLRVTFTAVATNFEPIAYAWLVDGDTLEEIGDEVTVTFIVKGSHYVLATATDAAGNIVTAPTVAVSVDEPATLALTATADPTVGLAPLDVAFSATATGGIAPYTFHWDFDDGTTSEGEDPTHTFTEAGGFEVLVTVTDLVAVSRSERVNVTATAPNASPVAVDDIATTDEDTPLTLEVLANDTDADGDELLVTAVTAPAHGETEITPDDGAVVYTPAADYFGADSFTYTVGDGAGGTATASVAVTVDAVGDCPRPEPDSASTDEDTPVVIDVLANDVEVDGEALNIVEVTQLAHGTATTDGAEVTFMPHTNFFGTGSFTYTVEDGSGDVATAHVTVTVDPVNDVPIIGDMVDQLVQRDTPTLPIAFAVGDDETAAADLVVTAASANETLVPNDGTHLALGGSGSDRTLVVSPASGAWGQTTITLTVADADGGLANEAFVLTVNALPTISDVADQIAQRDTPTTPIPFTVGDGESDPGDLSVTAVSSDPDVVPNDPSHLTLGGSDSHRTLVATPAAAALGATTITLTVTDPHGGGGTDTFVLTVNDPPTAVTPNDVLVQENTAVAVPLDVGDLETAVPALALSATSDNPLLLPESGLLVGLSDTDTWRLTITPLSDQWGTATVTVTIHDGDGGQSSTSFGVRVNDRPTIGLIGDMMGQQSPTPFDVEISDGETAPAGLVLSAVSDNTVLLPSDQILFSGTTVLMAPAAGQWGTTNVTVTVTDPDGGTDSTSFVFTVNAGPLIDPITPTWTLIDTPSEPIPVHLIDPDSPQAGWTVTAASLDLDLVASSGLVVEGTGADRTLTVTPNSGVTGTATLQVQFQDGWGGDNSVTFPFTIDAPPALEAIPDTRIQENQVLFGGIEVADTITPVADLTLAGVSSNEDLVASTDVSLAWNGGQWVLTATPAADHWGTTDITIAATDEHDLTAEVTFTLMVNDQPIVGTIGARSTPEDTPLAIVLPLTDGDHPVADLTVTGTSEDQALVPDDNLAFAFDGESHVLTVTPAANAFGDTVIHVTVEDPEGGTGTGSFSLAIASVNDPPGLTTFGNGTVAEDEMFWRKPFMWDVETPPGDLLLTVTSSDPAIVPDDDEHIVIVPLGIGEWRDIYVYPAEDAFGTVTLTFTVADGDGASTEVPMQLTVVPVIDITGVTCSWGDVLPGDPPHRRWDCEGLQPRVGETVCLDVQTDMPWDTGEFVFDGVESPAGACGRTWDTALDVHVDVTAGDYSDALDLGYRVRREGAEGHVVLLGFSYQTALVDQMKLLRNAVALSRNRDRVIRVVGYTELADASEVAAVDQVILLSAPELQRDINAPGSPSVAHVDSASALSEALAETDVLVLYPQSETAGVLEGLGASLRRELQEFVNRGGVVIALDYDTGTGGTADLLRGSGLLLATRQAGAVWGEPLMASGGWSSLEREVWSAPAPEGAASFALDDADEHDWLMGAPQMGPTVVHRRFAGPGRVVLIGHDYEPFPVETATLLANAILSSEDRAMFVSPPGDIDVLWYTYDLMGPGFDHMVTARDAVTGFALGLGRNLTATDVMTADPGELDGLLVMADVLVIPDGDGIATAPDLLGSDLAPTFARFLATGGVIVVLDADNTEVPSAETWDFVTSAGLMWSDADPTDATGDALVITDGSVLLRDVGDYTAPLASYAFSIGDAEGVVLDPTQDFRPVVLEGRRPDCILYEDFELGVWPVWPWTYRTSIGSPGTLTDVSHGGAWALATNGWYYEPALPFGGSYRVLRAWVRTGATDGSGAAYLGFNSRADGTEAIRLNIAGDPSYLEALLWHCDGSYVLCQDIADYALDPLAPDTWYEVRVIAMGVDVVVEIYDANGSFVTTFAFGDVPNPDATGLALSVDGDWIIDDLAVCRSAMPLPIN